MTPAARLQAAIEVLTDIDAMPRPADAVISAYFRSRRYIGSKDRAAVAETVYTVLRRHARLLWWLEREGAEATPRTRAMANDLLGERRAADTLIRLFDGTTYAPAPLSPDERRLIRVLETHTLDHPGMPDTVQGECPSWAEAPLRAALGDRFAQEMRALLEPAPLDLRINVLKTDRAAAQEALKLAGIVAEPTPWSPWCLRVHGRPPLATVQAFKDGLVEIQDEGSQLVALAVAPKPGFQVVDFCAGAGGKTLALAAMMNNKGRVVACDVLAGRLKRAAERFRRAGLHNIEPHPLTSERDPWVKRHKRKFDRVLVDVPCTGTGTWRRNPDSRWRPLGPGLDQLVPLQAAILESAARLVKPGGWLVYATCSLLPDENERQIEVFLASHPEFTPKPVADIWAGHGLGAPPCEGPWLRLTPARHATDAFFAAVLERRPEEAPEPLLVEAGEPLYDGKGEAEAQSLEPPAC
jgi:16S rRNA (cytosine967-C5)-methyltransferase